MRIDFLKVGVNVTTQQVKKSSLKSEEKLKKIKIFFSETTSLENWSTWKYLRAYFCVYKSTPTPFFIDFLI